VTDSTVDQGQEYYYAVTAYDTAPIHSVSIRPKTPSRPAARHAAASAFLRTSCPCARNSPVMGYVAASTSGITRVAGRGTGTVGVDVVNSNIVPDGTCSRSRSPRPAEDSIRASSYTFTDSTTGQVLSRRGATWRVRVPAPWRRPAPCDPHGS